MAAAKYARGALDRFSAARYEYARSVASMTEKPDTFAEALVADGAHVHLRALMADRDSEATRVTATAALAVLVAHDARLAVALADDGLLGELVAAFERPGAPPAALRAVLDVVRAVAAHGPALAAAAADEPGLLGCVGSALREPDAPLREAAAATAAVLAAASPAQAHALADDGELLPLVVACLAADGGGGGGGGASPRMKRAAAGALAEVARHDATLATAVVDAGALPLLLALLPPQDPRAADARLRRLATAALSAIVGHSEALADAALACGLLPRVLDVLLRGGGSDGSGGTGGDGPTRRGAVAVLRDVCKHSAAKAAAVADAGGLHALAAYANSCSGSGDAPAAITISTTTSSSGGSGGRTKQRGASNAAGRSSAGLPAVMALGYAAAFSPALAQRVLNAGGADAAKAALLGAQRRFGGEGTASDDDHCRAAAVWALGHMGRHSAGHAGALAERDVYRHVAAVLAEGADGGSDSREGGTQTPSPSADLRAKALRCLTVTLAHCEHVPAMQALVAPGAHRDVLLLALTRLAEVLGAPDGAASVEAKKAFLASGGLRAVQSLPGADDGTDADLAALAGDVVAAFPPEVAAYFRPGYATHVLAERIVDDDGDAERLDTDAVAAVTGAPAHSASS